jgi:mono/diheme cytochrome c family protein
VKKALKWIGIVLAALIGLALLGAMAAVVVVQLRINQSYPVDAMAVAVPSDEVAIARGEHLATSVAGCQGCHGEDLGGRVLIDDPQIMTLYGPNLTRGKGGAAASFDAEDWDRAIRHGVGPDGKSLLLMPAQNFHALTDSDLAAVVAYIESRSPVDNTVPRVRLGPMGYLLALSEPGFLPASLIDQSEPTRESIQEDVTAEYGDYLVWLGTCRDCHGPHLSGRQLPLPGEPPSRNLTPGGELVGWTQRDFISTVRTGVTPSGDVLREPMAGVLEGMRGQSDDELAAIFLYLQSLPPLEFGSK